MTFEGKKKIVEKKIRINKIKRRHVILSPREEKELTFGDYEVSKV